MKFAEYIKENAVDEALGRGMMKAMPTRNPKKLEKILKKHGIKYSLNKGQIMVGDDDWDDVEELMARNLMF